MFRRIFDRLFNREANRSVGVFSNGSSDFTLNCSSKRIPNLAFNLKRNLYV